MGLISPYFELTSHIERFFKLPRKIWADEEKNWHPGEFVRNAFQDAPKKIISSLGVLGSFGILFCPEIL
jgi:hypothetical protein